MEEKKNEIDNDIITTTIGIFKNYLKYSNEFNNFLHEVKIILNKNNKFEAEEIKIDNINDYDCANIYYTKLLKKLNNELPKVIPFDFAFNKSLRIYYIILIIKMLIAVINVNHSNLNEDMINFIYQMFLNFFILIIH